jgi:predicted amidophosphoribosyltransferase
MNNYGKKIVNISFGDLSGEPPSRKEKGRVCKACGKKLSRYNTSKNCFVCQRKFGSDSFDLTRWREKES